MGGCRAVGLPSSSERLEPQLRAKDGGRDGLLGLLILLLLPTAALADPDSDPLRLPRPAAAADASPPGELRLPLVDRQGLSHVVVRRLTRPDRVSEALELLSRSVGPAEHAAGLRSLFPAGARLLQVTQQQGHVGLLFDEGFLVGLDDAATADDRTTLLLGVLSQLVQPLRGLAVQVRRPSGEVAPLSAFLGGEEPSPFPPPLRISPALDWSPADRLPWGGPLAGRTIVVSPGHGYRWDSALDGYKLQRPSFKFTDCGSCQGIIEDISNAEIVQYHLLPMLEAAGARVISVRERDFSSAEEIVDDQDPAYQEEGEGWTAGNSGGGHGDTYRVLAPGSPGRAVWRLPPLTGARQLSLRWRAGPNRTGDALLRVHCQEPVVEYHLDQRERDDRWVYLGAHTCAAEGGFVELLHGPRSDGYLVADAVRLGGGVDASAGQPRWQMGAASYVPFVGATSLAGVEDVTIRPRYANWEGADLYLAVHSNAWAGGSRGTSTYRFNCLSYPDHSAAAGAADCDQPPGSARLAELAHTAVVAELRRSWDPNWRDIGVLVANFGELRPLEGIPGTLVELAFHDNLTPIADARTSDNQALHDPRFRRAAARGLTTGVIRFLAGEDAPLPPAAPEQLVVLPDETTGSLVANWQAVPRARGYRVRLAQGGRIFDGGRVVEEPRFTLPDAGAGVTWYFRITALGDGGESLPSETGGARLAAQEPLVYLPVLIVSGFDREDAWITELENDHAYVVEHGEALAGAGPFSFGSAANEALGGEALAGFRPGAIDWILGVESTEHETFSSTEQEWLRAYLAGGGSVVASGAEIAWDLDFRGSLADRAFLGEVFGAAMARDDAGSYQVVTTAAGPLAELAGQPPMSFDDGTHGTYDVMFPDVFAPVADAAVAAVYPEGGAAGVAFSGAGGRAMLFGFPLETVHPLPARAALLGAVARWLLPAPTVRPVEEDVGVREDATVPDAGDLADGGLPADVDPVDGGPGDDGGLHPDAGDGGPADLASPDAGPRDGGPDLGATVDGGSDLAVTDLGVRRDSGGPADQGGEPEGDLTPARPDSGLWEEPYVGCECATTASQSSPRRGGLALMGSIFLGILLLRRRG
ncbi:MAG: N-acetylmuramoyl-L-alanine amidase [Myxococcota bacterium]|jgi:N-acetylmuramoyl-L-alanine amidase|nr:N-acetylmuramoyl-L-alanine amidase [Myxococcota bacterium]